MSRLHLHILGSGSKGNCALIEGPQGLIMVDDGLSRREILKKAGIFSLAQHGHIVVAFEREDSTIFEGVHGLAR